VAEQLTSTAQYSLVGRRRSRRILLVALVLSGAAALLLLKFPPGWISLVLCLAAAFIAVTWHRPALGVACILGLTLLFEQYDFAPFRPITQQVPFFTNLSYITGVSAFDVNPLEILLVALTAVVFVQLVSKRMPVRASPLILPVALFAFTVFCSLALGLATGGSFKISLWELRGFGYFCLLALLVPQSLESMRDVYLVMWTAIATVGIKSAQGIWNWVAVLHFDRSEVRSVTGHEDALFIAWMFILLAGLLAYRTARGQRLVLLALTPVMLLTFYLTDRRAAYAAMAMGLFVLAALIATDRAKRRLLVTVGIPLLLLSVLLVGAGWNSGGVIGKPAAVVRSIVAPNNEVDVNSSYYRRAEAVNLMRAIDSSPLLGLGFGQPFQSAGEGGIVDIGFSLENYIAHDAILWVWAKMGTFGFALFWVMVGAVIVQGGIVFRAARQAYSKVLAALAACAIAMQMIVSSVDLQLTYARNMVFLGVLVGILAALPRLDGAESAGD